MKADAEVVMGLRTARFAPDHVSIMLDRLLYPLGFQKSIREICFGVRIAGLHFERLCKMADGQIGVAVFQVGRADLKIRVRIVWMSGKHNLELRDRLIKPVILEQKLSHSEMSDVVLAGDGECSVPKSLGVVPVRSLDPGPPGKQDNNNRPGNAENFTAPLQRPCKIDHCPRRSDA